MIEDQTESFTLEVPTRTCHKHGKHTDWVQLSRGEPGVRSMHYCFRCIVEHISTLDIGRAPE